MKQLFFYLSIISLAAVATAQCKNTSKEHEPGFTITNGKTPPETGLIQYKIVRDTIYIDRSRPINKPWYSYEIESTEDSIYLYSGRELVERLHRDKATLYTIDSIILKDNE